MLNLRSKIFQNYFVYRALWTLNFSKGGGGEGESLSTNISCHDKFETRHFSEFLLFTEHSGLNFSEWGLGQIILVKQNLRPKNF